MKSEEYWNDAALRREIAVQTGTNYTGEEILKLYDEALSDIDTEIQKIKINFQKRFGIDNETAEYFLTQAQQEDNLKTLIKSLEYAPDEQARQDILAYIRRDGLSVRAYAARKERYEAVKAVIYARIKKVAVKEIEKLSERLQAVYKESYYGVIDDSAKQFDVGINFAILNENAINAAVSTKWHGKQFSERVWDNTDRLATTAQNLVVKSLMSGEAWSKTAEKLSTAFQVEKYNATRLIHTESSHIHAMADLKAYEDIGAEQYRYLATLDYRTCERCQQWDNMVLPLSEAREGYNYPVLHPLCRCTTTIAVDLKNRRARDPLTGKNDIVDGSMNYSEWYNSLSDEQKAALKLSKRKDSNKTSDKLQHAKYVKVLGTKEVPRSFDKWQELKYNDSEQWGILKSKAKGMIYYNKALQKEPQITEFIKKQAVENGFKIQGLNYRIKSKESYLRKIESKYSENGNKYEINDILRYTYIGSNNKLTEKTLYNIQDMKQKGYETIKIKNTWNDKNNPYKGINTIVKDKDGFKFEVQYHTQESFNLKNNEMHELYEKARVLEKNSEEYLNLSKQMFDMSEKLHIPKDIEKVK
jgi:SPP1 gp7 family putative phage head morphogenesis protein